MLYRQGHKQFLQWAMGVTFCVACLSLDNQAATAVVYDEIVRPNLVSWVDIQSKDFDGDNLSDEEEKIAGTDPLFSDTDGDGIVDGWELLFNLDPKNPLDSLADIDRDGLSNHDEFIMGTSPLLADTDGDGFWDGIEARLSTDPLKAASYPTSSVSGDLDCDGIVDACDLQIAINAALGFDTPVPTDATGDGKSTGADVESIRNLLMR